MRVHINCRIISSRGRSDLKKLLISPSLERAQIGEEARCTSRLVVPSDLTNSPSFALCTYANKLARRGILYRADKTRIPNGLYEHSMRCEDRNLLTYMNTLYLVLAFSLISA